MKKIFFITFILLSLLVVLIILGLHRGLIQRPSVGIQQESQAGGVLLVTSTTRPSATGRQQSAAEIKSVKWGTMIKGGNFSWLEELLRSRPNVSKGLLCLDVNYDIKSPNARMALVRVEFPTGEAELVEAPIHGSSVCVPVPFNLTVKALQSAVENVPKTGELPKEDFTLPISWPPPGKYVIRLMVSDNGSRTIADLVKVAEFKECKLKRIRYEVVIGNKTVKHPVVPMGEVKKVTRSEVILGAALRVRNEGDMACALLSGRIYIYNQEGVNLSVGFPLFVPVLPGEEKTAIIPGYFLQVTDTTVNVYSATIASNGQVFVLTDRVTLREWEEYAQET